MVSDSGIQRPPPAFSDRRGILPCRLRARYSGDSEKKKEEKPLQHNPTENCNNGITKIAKSVIFLLSKLTQPPKFSRRNNGNFTGRQLFLIHNDPASCSVIGYWHIVKRIPSCCSFASRHNPRRRKC